MTARRGIACVAVIAAMLGAAPAARAQDEGGQSLLSRLRYSAEGSIMSGVGPQGRPLGRGPALAFNVHGESALGMEMGVEAAWASSNDILRTRFTSLSAIVRLSPTPEDYRAYVQLGAGIYSVTFSPDSPGVAKPDGSVRPGGSFGVGLDVIDGTTFSLGGILQYNGVILAGSQARSYLTAGVTLTFKPSPY